VKLLVLKKQVICPLHSLHQITCNCYTNNRECSVVAGTSSLVVSSSSSLVGFNPSLTANPSANCQEMMSNGKFIFEFCLQF